MRPQRIDHLRSLPHQKIARPMQHQPVLLLGRFDLYETHSRPPHCLADRLSVGGIVLVAFDVSLHVLRRHQSNQVEELQHLAPPQLLPDNDPFVRVNPVNLKHVLGDIQTDRRDLHVDSSLM